MADKTLVTFRYDREKWEAMKEMANTEGTNASAVFAEFVDWYLAGNRVSGDAQRVPTTHLDNSPEKRIDNVQQRLDEEIHKRDERIDNLDRCIDEIRSQLEELRGKLTAR